MRTLMKFPRCKLCGEKSASRYVLPETVVYACSHCDLHFIDYLDDLSAQEPAEGRILDDRGRKYIEERLPAAEALLPLRFRMLAKHLEPAGARCLDIGAGVGQFLHRLQGAGAEGVGIEPSRLRRQFGAERFDIRLSPEPVESPGWDRFSDYFDAVTLWEVIEHVNDPAATVRAACSLLKPGGLLFLETPSRSVPAYRLSEWCYRLSRGQFPLFLGNFYSPIPFGHKQIFTPDQLTRLVAGSGFQIVFRGSSFPGAARPVLAPRDKIILAGRKNGA